MGLLRRIRAPERTRWDEPGICPVCGDRARLDRIDLVTRETYQHCAVCAEWWVTPEIGRPRRL